ncbi:MAG: HAMP domain-containing sensor histidine kinase [Ekhidna sp.]
MKPNLKSVDPFSTIITRLGLRNDKVSEEQRKVIKELATSNQKLLDAERMKSNFLSNIRNEINNPITSVLELSKRITEGTLDEKQTRKYADLIYSEAFNLDCQMRNIIAAAEIESGELGISLARISVYSIIFDTLNCFKHLIAKKNLRLEVNNSAEDSFCTDPEKLELILRNLIANAIEFNNDSASIGIDVKQVDDQLIVSISDNGIGIDEEKRNYIYNRFQQLEEGVTKPHKGQGLGLSLVKSLLDLLGGTLEAETNSGGGSVFTVSIPQSNSQGPLSSDSNGFLFDSENEIAF